MNDLHKRLSELSKLGAARAISSVGISRELGKLNDSLLGNGSPLAKIVRDDLLRARSCFAQGDWAKGMHWLSRAIGDLEPQLGERRRQRGPANHWTRSLSLATIEAELRRRGMHVERLIEPADETLLHNEWVLRVNGEAVARAKSLDELEAAVDRWWTGNDRLGE